MSKRSERLYLITLVLMLYIFSLSAIGAASARDVYAIPPDPPIVSQEVPEYIETSSPDLPKEPQPVPETEWVCPLTDEEVELIALLTMTEAEGESEEGQRLVIDTVLNRVDSPYFPNTVYDVVYQKNQYSGICGERVKRCWVKEEICELVRNEVKERTNDEVVFFRTKHYHSFGVPMFQVGNHYFSKYE